ncbi:hypothetical protein E3U23_11135 [Erythrobacter litoralis]|uniref:hypothetical protein n=1 Tax=Erythrobacter litoralis TaxID=39960 RepID=UPI002434B13A|nr:hypothetical protein [Erythrobacter litoralis]MDG6079742.1 hypothetical protein [Erythrobacter litoralis]
MILDLLLAAAPTMSAPDVVEAGRVMAELDDWRAILFVALVLCALMLAALLGVVFMAFRAWTKSADALGAVREVIAGLNIIVARIETRLGIRDDE